MTKNSNDIKNLISDLLEKPKTVTDDKISNLTKVVIPSNLLEDDVEEKIKNDVVSSSVIYGDLITGNNNIVNNYFNTDKKYYQRDTSAISINRNITDYRQIGEEVKPHHMTRNEYISYLGYLYQIANVHKWNGIERLHHRPNWTADFSHNVQNYDEALDFIGIEKNAMSPDGIEKRMLDRRKGLKDIRSKSIERRNISAKGRRKEDLFNYAIYFSVVCLLLLIIVTWVAFSVKEVING